MSKGILFAAVFALSCEGMQQERRVSSNPHFKVDKLFEHDGCTVYRFEDGYTRYFVKCPCSGTTSRMVPCGKNCQRPDHIVTSGGEEP